MESRRTGLKADRQGVAEADFTQFDPMTSRGMAHKGETNTSLSVATFDHITWIPNIAADLGGKLPVSGQAGLAPSHDNSEVMIKREQGVRDSFEFADPNVQSYRIKRMHSHSSTTDTKAPVLSTSSSISNQTLVQKPENVNIGGLSPRVVYVLPQTGTSSTNSANFMIPKTNVAGESVEYQSKLEKAVTKAGRKKRMKTSLNQYTADPGITGTGLPQEVSVPDVDPRLMTGTVPSDTAPFFIAVPLRTMTVGLRNTADSEVNITHQQYHQLLSSENENDKRIETDKRCDTVGTTRTEAPVTEEIPHGTPDKVAPETQAEYNPRLSALPKLDQVHVITEKMYEDGDLSRIMLEAMWHMIDADLFWDAVLYIGTHHIKVHKLVMASISSVVHAKVLSSDESVLKLKLPADLDHDVVNIFVKYLYHGKIMITKQNVQDLYRISSIFEMDKLKKYCYDFCKITKMAHIIINSPQEDTMKAVQFGEAESKIEESELPSAVDEISNATNNLIANIDLEATEITLELAKVENKKGEYVFDWSGIDENESNIPIRKRGRSRKGIINASVAPKVIISGDGDDPSKTDNVNGDSNLDETVTATDVNLRAEINEKVPGTATPFTSVQEKNSNEPDLTAHEKGEFTIITNEDGAFVAEVESGSNQEKDTDVTILPDPFDSGQFDESKLQQATKPTRTMVTRFRGRNKNILEAAANKKARLDEGTERDHKVDKKKEYTEQLLISKVEDTSPSISEAKVKYRKQEKKDVKTTERKRVKRLRGNDGKHLSSPVQSPEIEMPAKTPENSVSDHATSPQPVTKKGRAKKSTVEHEVSQKIETPMRPPPKKRTKEIREMMKNVENDAEISVDKLIQDELSAPSKLPKKKSRSKSGNLCLPKSAKLLDQIAAIDEKGRLIAGDKMFRCEFCGNEYLCVRRVITHVVKTHDIALDNSVQHITVLQKNLSPKMCDICGYRAKDSNIYYIHFHKYFRHGVPLPQGWKPFKCDFCGKEFFTKFQLKEHKLTHFEETPFVCEHCGNGFKTRTCLNSHVFHKHSTVKKHSCPDCVKTFKTRTQMLVHSRTHSGEKPFSCPSCTYKSTTRGNMRLHLTNKHKYETDTIKNIMENLKAAEPEVPFDEDGNVIKMKESGFSIKLGPNNGQVLQIDPAGSAETRSMDTLADVASIKAFGQVRQKNLVEEPIMHDQSVMADIEGPRSYEDQYFGQEPVFNEVKPNSTLVPQQEIQVIQDSEFVDQNNPRPVQFIVTNSETNNSIEMRVLEPEEYPVQNYRANDKGSSEQKVQAHITADRNSSNSGIQPQDSRMAIRNDLRQPSPRTTNKMEEFDSRSLLKEALTQNYDQQMDPRDISDTQVIQVSESFFQEGSNLLLNSQTEQIDEHLLSVHNQYANSSRSQTYESNREFSAAPLQLVMNSSNLQNKGYQHTPLSPHAYNEPTSSKDLPVRQSDIPTVITEDIPQAEPIQGHIHPQSLTANQTYEELTSQSSSGQHLNSEEHQIMYDNYYQQSYHQGYQQT